MLKLVVSVYLLVLFDFVVSSNTVNLPFCAPCFKYDKKDQKKRQNKV